MSETESWKGVLNPTGKTVAEYMAGKEWPAYYDKSDPEDLLEWFRDVRYRTAVIVNNTVYEVQKEEMMESDIFESTILPNGNIEFIVQYYNGGCSFDEAIDYATKNNPT